MKRCYACSEEKEKTRPFGEHGQDVCFDCMKGDPVQYDIATNNLSAIVAATSFISPTGIVTIDGEEIRPTMPGDILIDPTSGKPRS